MLGLNMASGSITRIFGPIAAGTLYSVLGHDWPFLVGAALTVPAAVLGILLSAMSAFSSVCAACGGLLAVCSRPGREVFETGVRAGWAA